MSAFENAKEFTRSWIASTGPILLDVMPPDESGYDIVKALRNVPADTGYSYYNGHSQDHRDGYDKRV